MMSGAMRVVCGLSGGVDSGVAAMLLKNKGYDVVGLFMRIWKASGDEGLNGVCPSGGDYENVRLVANKLKIPLLEVDFEKEYWNMVFSDFLKDYEEGRTPNPDILCNQYIKFGCFFRYCTENLGACAVATGHYANTNFGYHLEKDDRFKAKLLKAKDRWKDQTFFLSRIPQSALKKTIFPVGHLKKSEVRQLAKDNGLDNIASKPDSTGICFIGPRQFSQFIDQYLEPKPGVFVDIDTGATVGHHLGVHHWTLGQRCNIGGQLKAYYVAFRHPRTQTIYVAAGHHNPALYSSSVLVHDIKWVSEEMPEQLAESGRLDCYFKFQQTENAIPCVLSLLENGSSCNGMKVTFINNGQQRALTPGQFSVFYVGAECVGSARVRRGINEHALINLLYSELGL